MLVGDLLQAAIDAEIDYNECAARHEGLINWATAATKRFGEK
jgi:hypothetical protein